jgi:hypothetical protein
MLKLRSFFAKASIFVKDYDVTRWRGRKLRREQPRIKLINMTRRLRKLKVGIRN